MRAVPSTSSDRLVELFNLEGLLVREHVQQDKEGALCAVARMFSDFGVPYVISGGIAVQLYVSAGEVRFTADVDVVSLQHPFKQLKEVQPWQRYGFEFVFDRRRYVKLKHAASNVEVDINLDARFARMLDTPTVESVGGLSVPFTSPVSIAFAKLRTQRADWPRDPAKRLQDRADLIRILRNHPGVADRLRGDPDVTAEMRAILDQVQREMTSSSASDDFPDADDPSATPGG